MEGRNYKRDKRSPVPKNATVSHVMSRIKGKNTKPELALRKALYEAGLRGYRLNYSKLPGKPDIVYNKRKLAVFVHGCYWHGCEVCGWKTPKHNSEYWTQKIGKNRDKDKKKRQMLEELGYTVLTLWEHDIKNIDEIVNRIKRNFFDLSD